MNKNTIIISTIAIVVFIIVAYFLTNKPVTSNYAQIVKPRTTVSESAKIPDHLLGKGPHILVEYSDLQCPACKAFHEYLLEEKKKDVSFGKLLDTQYTIIYRNFPLTNIHKNAQLAAQSVEAAGMQGKFYEFLTKAFADQTTWAQSDTAKQYFISIAKDLGLKTDQFTKDIDSADVIQKINIDIQTGTQTNLEATPTFFIDGNKVTGIGSFEDLKKLLIESAK